MRHFSSYGPVECKQHFCIPREGLINQCTTSLVGGPDEGGHYFTIWAPRQAGKTWLMRQVVQKIQAEYGDRFLIATLSMQGVVLKDEEPADAFLSKIPFIFNDGFDLEVETPTKWEGFEALFRKAHKQQLFSKPLILFIDEFDSLPRHVIDRLVTTFRDMYLKRDRYVLHGLALIGVRAVLGVESQRGSPFNVQRSLHVPNFTFDEVNDLYRQYQEESGQTVLPEVVTAVYTATNGQPGLVCWFGELLTEKHNPGIDKVIDLKVWEDIYERACFTEFNNTVLNMIKKARTEYSQYALALFSRSDVPFSLDVDWCNYMYLHGLIAPERIALPSGQPLTVCRYSCPFIQLRVYNALTYDLFDNHLPILALEPLDTLADVFEGATLDLPALLQRYIAYLARLKAKGLNPLEAQPRRTTDLHLTEAVGHFHLYSWLQNAVGRRCVVSPEFPTGNGKVDLHLTCGQKRGIIEVKSFVDAYQASQSRIQAARYAKQLHYEAVTIAMFVPIDDPTVLAQLSGDETIEGVRVTVVAIGWM